MAKAKVLLVEDDPVQAEATKSMLIASGHDVVWVHDGISAIKQTKGWGPDIILLDLILPGMDGYEICRWLKTEESTKGIPVIMLTAKNELSDKISGLVIGADDYLPKPYNEPELAARIHASLRTKALQDELRQKNSLLEELLAKVAHMAVTDALTGLANRRKFHDVLAAEFEKAKRYKTPFSVVMLDIDFFKKVNDSYGHQTGDGVLMEVAGIVLHSVREIDTACRFGGEEFVIIMPNTDKVQAMNSAERIRESVCSHKFPGLEKNITVSLGISGLPDSSISTQDALIKCSDLALYRAKQHGRNRTEIAEGKDIEGGAFI